MSDDVEHIIIEHLKALRNQIATFERNTEDRLTDVLQRMIHLERTMASVKRDQADVYDDHARQQVSIDALAQRITRIEKRLELS